MAATLDPTTLPYGSKKLTVTRAAGGTIQCVAEDIQATKTSQVAVRRDENNEPAGRVIVPDVVEGTLTFQLPESTTVPLVVGDTFSAALFYGTTSTWVITQAGISYTQGDFTKMPISFAKQIN